MELGVLLELPDPVRLAILGLINVGLPSAEEALIELHIDVLGVIDFAAKKLAIDGSLFDSRVLIYALTGDLVMRLTWGSDPNFLFSLGGFNPHFDTSGMNLPPLKRMAVSIGDGDNPRISSNSYFAVTSNTLQFGANTEAFASAGGFSVHGYLGYDVLVVYSPFSFTFDFKASFDVAVDGLTLTAFDIDGTFSGPRPWHLHAHVSIHLLFFDVGASLTLEWGELDAGRAAAAGRVAGPDSGVAGRAQLERAAAGRSTAGGVADLAEAAGADTAGSSDGDVDGARDGDAARPPNHAVCPGRTG